MELMSESEWRAFVSAGTRTGMAGVVRPDGRPHVTPIWFVLDGDELVFTTAPTSVKGRALRRDPRLTVCVDDQAPPFSYVMIEGEARIFEDDLAALRHWATVIGGRYMGTARAEEYGARNGAPPEVVVRVHIGKVIARKEIAT
ncbi:PPOX class F420-dependent oxidoreductase [Actinopolymorpha sp. B9G3]|uniref:PPOX class F420-dependent oxidoreductase n=1 Tax=Actinopolymorpha sp. B9G3 TaxID=3158970 RepID=UPI0032D8E9C6